MSSTSNNTVFLTPEETERIQKSLKGRLQKCQELAGQPRVSGDSNFRLNQVATASFLSDIVCMPEDELKVQKDRLEAMTTFGVGSPYQPCTLLLQDLQLIKLGDLRMNTHHRGCVITVRRVAPVVKLVVWSWTVVQEEFSDETERLEISLHKSKGGQDILESTSWYKIKEPFFTLSDQGEPTIRVDHPTDLVLSKVNLYTVDPNSSAERRSYSEGVPSDNAPKSPSETEKTPGEYKEDGNTALGLKDLARAHANYTRGLQLVTTDVLPKDDLTCDLFRNRAHVNLALNRLNEAKADALASLTRLDDQRHKDLDSKAFFRAGCAAYGLSEFQEAKRYFEKQRELMPGDRAAISNLRKTEQRLQEQATGVYNFKKIMASLLVARPRVDVASFTLNTEIKESPGRGRGLFTTREIAPGEIIFCEKAFCVVWGHEDEALTAITYDDRDGRIRVFPAGLCKAVVQKLLDNPSEVEKIMDLCGDYPGIGRQLIIRDSSTVIDTFQVHDIVARNAFGPGPAYPDGRYDSDENAKNASTGLWIVASYMNHSCIPNAKKEYMGDLMVVRATRRIGAAEEITQSYDESHDYDTRTKALMNTWGFTCACALCIAEKADSQPLRKKRQELEMQANYFMEKNDTVCSKRLSILKAQRFARSINDTYDDERYNDLPRRALENLQKWLIKSSSQ